MDSLTQHRPLAWPVKKRCPLGLALSMSILSMSTLHGQAHAGSDGSAPAFTPQTPAATLPAPQYRSVFTRYQSHGDQPVAAWPTTNATVEKIGGWRAYAKEASQPDTADPLRTPGHTGTHGERGRKP